MSLQLECAGTIWDSCRVAADISTRYDCRVEFHFNGLDIHAEAGESADKLLARWERANQRRAKG